MLSTWRKAYLLRRLAAESLLQARRGSANFRADLRAQPAYFDHGRLTSEVFAPGPEALQH